ncbi:GPI-anchor biosynthetic protein [Aspergillus ochraceoroseus]|uniref:GPI ethanolamine phosphate transferase 1 n=2 Tax=Aspergillus ochraceoroseus TaxID=138278 RepID=A0A0F8VLE8_9EURO|nr:GPI-anchor biosynthetic protein [Aspergillus ochraceoroseus]
MPKRKATTRLSGLIGSDDEDVMQAAPDQGENNERPTKKARGRPRSKSAEMKPPVHIATDVAATAPQSSDTATKRTTRRGRPKGSRNSGQMEAEGQDITPQETDGDDGIGALQGAPQPKKSTKAAKGATRGRRKPSAEKQIKTDGEFEYTPTSTRHKKPTEKAEAPAEPASRIQRKSLVEAEESGSEAEKPVQEVIEETVMHEELPEPRSVSVSPAKRRQSSQKDLQSSPFKRKSSAGDDDRGNGEPELRRRLGDLTKKYDTLENRYRNLKEIGIVEANSNMEKLRKQCESMTTASNNLVTSLKTELETQKALGGKSRLLQKQLRERDAEVSRLTSQAEEATSQLAAAQSEVKALQTKLAAARSTAATLESAALKVPGSAIKGGGANRANAAANAEAAHMAQFAQLKEDLYSDLTGLIIRDVKKRETNTLYDCIQTGVNGTLHFKLVVPHVSSVNFEKAEFQYIPLLDENRDRELVDILPEYLTVDITFVRQQASKFYTRISIALGYGSKLASRTAFSHSTPSLGGSWRKGSQFPIMARLGRTGFVTLAVIFHLIYCYSIFDIYFVSPIVSGMRSFQVERDPGTSAPAKRLVLFVADGLRADKAFQPLPDPDGYEDPDSSDPIHLAPFIRSRVLSHGTFGISHTRVPTESRPGHVALIAGLYEDVSSVTTGWKLNPVNFDSVFNRSRHTWSWGSPDILPMFKEGAVPGRVDADMYGEEAEDFTMDATLLDTWVFDKVQELFASAKSDPELDRKLREDKLVFFLHLLGLDTTGHSYRPYSKEYLRNIKLVDEGVKRISQIVENFYGDDSTAFVFTADHGMSDWGSHGDGHPDNTRTPLVVWGSGVAAPKHPKDGVPSGHEDGVSSEWNLGSVQRNDVAQADVAALMAYLVGLDFPTNSVGQLPLEYLDASPREKALAAFANMQEVLEMYRVKEEHKKEALIRYIPFEPLADGGENSVEQRLTAIEELIRSGSYQESIEKSAALFLTTLEGLRYLQTYDWLFLRTIVTLGYLGWIAYALTTVIDLHVLHGTSDSNRTTSSTIFFSSILVVLFSVFFYQGSSWRYYFYGFFPVFFWEEVFSRRKALIAGREILLGHVRSVSDHFSFGFQLLIFLGILEALVHSYFQREIYTVCFILGAFWPLFYGFGFLKKHAALSATWAVGCLLMSTFTLLPAIKVEDINTITYGAVLMLLAGLLYLLFEDNILGPTHHSLQHSTAVSRLGSRTIMGMQLGMVILAWIVTKSSIVSLQAKQGLPFGNQVVGWSVLVASLLLPFLHRLYPNSHYLHRLIVLFLTFSPTFIILTISYEGLFYFVFCMTLITWVRLEHATYIHTTATPLKRKNGTVPTNSVASKGMSTGATAIVEGETYQFRTLSVSDARVALFFFFLLQSAFFSTGNIASISSFSLDSVYRLIPVFNPFSQGALLVFKILIPFAIISANLGILNRRLEVAPSALFMVVMSISDVMTLNFFYMVRDEGSWLDIGTTISHFCIASGLCTFVAGLEFLSEVFIGGVDFGPRAGAITATIAGTIDGVVSEGLEQIPDRVGDERD